MKTFSRLVLATLIHIVSAVGNLRGDNRGIDTSSSFSSQPENVPKAENGVLAFDLSDDGIISERLEQGVRALELELESCPSDQYQFIAKIKTDNKPSDNAWALLKSGNGNTLARGEMTNWKAGVMTRLRMCLPLGAFIFRVTDSSDNGMCQDNGCGSVVITLDGVEIGKNENDDSRWSTTDFPVNIEMLTGKAAVTTTTTTTATSATTTDSTITTSIQSSDANSTVQHPPHSTLPSAANSTSTVSQADRQSSAPAVAAAAEESSLADFQDRIILLAAKIASDGEQGIGSLIIDKVCADAVAQRVVEAYHRQNKTVQQTIDGLNVLYNNTSS
eukprot:scaffold4092_cov150-Skeletonema_menzelii.AAC.5